MRPRIGPLGLAIALAPGGSAVARAQGGGLRPEAIHVELDAPNTCFDAERFFMEVRARTAHVRRADASEAARTLRVSVTWDGGQVVGRLVLEDRGQETTPRVVRAPTCEEAMSAMALVAALSVDPDSGAAASTDHARAASLVDPDSEAHFAPTPAAAVSETRERQWRFIVGGRIDAIFPSTPSGGARVAPGLFVGVAGDGPGIFAPELRLSGARMAGATVTTPVGTGHPVWLTLVPSFCPIRLFHRMLAACIDVEVGSVRIDTSGQGASNPSRPWVAPGLDARLDWPAFTLGSRARLLLGLELGLCAPVVRDTFYFIDNPDDFRVYSAPSLIPHGAFELGVRFR